ncbi:hypothetical protein ACTMTI_48205 [Nonomuraea sp. H19]|uniref:hypothetical protein n=1 Tax=Nonomuraea sp. H19 TaxID=3452206 RepID=UPI003F89462D
MPCRGDAVFEGVAKDSAKDGDLDCGTGAGDRIVIDKTLDPEPVGCETVERF